MARRVSKKSKEEEEWVNHIIKRMRLDEIRERENEIKVAERSGEVIRFPDGRIDIHGTSNVRIEPSWRNGRRIYIVKKELKNGYNEENAYHDLGDAEYYASKMSDER